MNIEEAINKNNYEISVFYKVGITNVSIIIDNIDSLQGINYLIDIVYHEYPEIFSNNLNELYITIKESQNLTSLKELYKLREDKKPYIKRFSLLNTQITNLDGLEELTFLTSLNIDNSNLTSLKGIEELNYLYHLSVKNSKLNDISTIKSLENNYFSERIGIDINFANNYIKDISCIEFISKTFTCLSLEENDIHINQLDYLKNLNIECFSIDKINIKKVLLYHGYDFYDMSDSNNEFISGLDYSEYPTCILIYNNELIKKLQELINVYMRESKLNHYLKLN